MLQNCKTASFDVQTNNEEIVYAWIKVLSFLTQSTRGVFYVRREVDLMKTAKVNAYIINIFGKIELLSIHAT